MATSAGINYEADVSDVLSKAAQFVKALQDQGIAIKELQLKQLEFNKDNKAAKAALVGVTEANEKVVVSLKKSKGSWEEQKTVVQNAKKAADDAAKASEAAAKKAEREAERRAKIAKKAAEDIEKQAKLAKKAEIDENKPQGRKTLLTFSDVARILEATIIKQTFNAITGAIGESISAAREFQIQISLIRTVSQDQQLSFQSWSEGLIAVSNRTGVALSDISKTAYDAIQSQVVFGAQAIQFTESAANLARVTGTTAQQAGDLLSSVIQGFQQSVAEADNTAAVLFKTVELGRIRMDELANTMGRVAPSAQTVGIRFEEVSAALATLTRQGIKTSDATTLLINVILKLAKPTEAMKRLLKDWGFESSQAAVKTLGFVEVLRRLEKTTDGQLGELAEYFNELRGLRGATGLTSAFQDFEADLSKIENASATYAEAQKIRAESSADTLTKFTNAAKNTFIGQFGSEIVDAVAQFADALGKGDVFAKRFADTILFSTAALVAGKAAMIAFGVTQSALNAGAIRTAAAQLGATAAQEAYNAAIAKGVPVATANTAAELARSAAIKEATAAQVGANATFARTIGVMGALGVAVVGAIGIWNAFDREIKNVSTNADNLNRVFQEANKVTKDQADTTAQKGIDRFQKQIRATLELPLKITAEAFKESEKNIANLGIKSKKTAEDFNVAYQLYGKGARERLNDANKQAEKLANNIKKSKDSILDFGTSLDDIIRKEQLSYATDQQKVILLKNEISRLTQDAETAYKKARETGDEDQLALGRDRLKEVAQLLTELNKIENDLNKQGFESALRADPSLAQYGTTFYATTIPLQEKFNQLKAKQIQLEGGIQSSAQKQIELLKKQTAGEDERLKRLDDYQQKLIDFDIYKDGKVREEFLSNNKIDPKKVQAELLKITQPVLQLTPDLELRSKLWETMAERYRTIMSQAQAEVTKQGIVEDQNRLTKLQDDLIKKYRESQEKIAQFSQVTFSDKGTLDTLKADVRSFRDFSSFRPDFIERNFNLNTDRQAVYQDAQRKSEIVAAQIVKIEQSLDRVRQNAATVQGQLVPRADDIAYAKRDFELLTTYAQRYVKALTGRDDYQNFAFRGKDGQTFRLGDLISDAEKQLNALSQGTASVDQSQKQIDNLVDSTKKLYIDTVQPLILKFPEMAAAGKNAFEQVGGAAKDQFQQVEEVIDRITAKLKALPAPNLGGLQGINADVNPAGLVGADNAQYLAEGGYVHPGKPRGTDVVPAWLTPGEFVMPANMTRKFFAQLVDMRRGIAPKYYSQGGLVTNRIGDINIHMESGGQPSATRIARQIGQELRREIRRGNLKLS